MSSNPVAPRKPIDLKALGAGVAGFSTDPRLGTTITADAAVKTGGPTAPHA